MAPGLYRIPLPLPDELRAVNAYAIAGEDGFTLIDSGLVLDGARDRLEQAMKELGAGLGDVRRFLVTHVHRDHYTQAVAIRRDFGAHVGLGAGERASFDVLCDPATQAYRQQLEDLRANGAQAVADAVLSVLPAETVPHSAWEAPDEWIESGSTLHAGPRRLEARATPGHTQGHLVYFDRAAAMLFAGDHVLPHITPSIGLEPVPGRSPLADYLGSLHEVRALPDARLLPAHGPVTASTHARIDELLEHHDIRLRRTAEAIGHGASTAFEAATVLRWTSRERRFAELAPFHQMLAVVETVWHLRLLATQQRVVAGEQDGIVHYWLGA